MDYLPDDIILMIFDLCEEPWKLAYTCKRIMNLILSVHGGYITKLKCDHESDLFTLSSDILYKHRKVLKTITMKNIIGAHTWLTEWPSEIITFVDCYPMVKIHQQSQEKSNDIILLADIILHCPKIFSDSLILKFIFTENRFPKSLISSSFLSQQRQHVLVKIFFPHLRMSKLSWTTALKFPRILIETPTYQYNQQFQSHDDYLTFTLPIM